MLEIGELLTDLHDDVPVLLLVLTQYLTQSKHSEEKSQPPTKGPHDSDQVIE